MCTGAQSQAEMKVSYAPDSSPFWYVITHNALIGCLLRGLATKKRLYQTDRPPNEQAFELQSLASCLRFLETFNRPNTIMSSRTLPLLFINLGGEMLYILDQRLRAQNIPADKAKKGS